MANNKPARKKAPSKQQIKLREGSCLTNRKVSNMNVLKQNVTFFVTSPKFSLPYSSWEEDEFVWAYIGYSEGWGIPIDEQKGIEILKAGYERHFYTPAKLLGEAYVHGYYGLQTDVRSGLLILREAFNLAGTNEQHADCAFAIGYAYTALTDTCWNTAYAIPWFQLYFAYGGIHVRSITTRAKELLEYCEDDTDPDSADYLVKEFNDNIYAFHKIYDDGKFTSTEGQIGNIVKNPFNGDFYMELMPSIPVNMPPDNPDDYAVCIRCFMKNPDELAGLAQGTTVKLRGMYTSEKGPALLLTDCEIYKEPMMPVPPLPSKKKKSNKKLTSKTIRALKD